MHYLHVACTKCEHGYLKRYELEHDSICNVVCKNCCTDKPEKPTELVIGIIDVKQNKKNNANIWRHNELIHVFILFMILFLVYFMFILMVQFVPAVICKLKKVF